VTDRDGHVHLGAVLSANAAEALRYLDMLAPVGAADVAELDLDRLVVLPLMQVVHLRQLVEICIDDIRLRTDLVRLLDLYVLTTSSPS
jgi:hypothetical protein